MRGDSTTQRGEWAKCIISFSPKSGVRTLQHSCDDNFLESVYSIILLLFGARGSIVGWGTLLPVGRSRVPDEVAGFFNWPNPSRRTMTLGYTQPLTEMSSRNLPVVKGDRSVRKADRHLWADCLENVGASTACWRVSFTFTFKVIKWHNSCTYCEYNTV
jgi:hypothetical protein